MVFRNRPYGQFRFLVDLAGGSAPDEFKAGFQEVSGLTVEVTTAEYRNGNAKESGPMKINGAAKYGDVTLKRGVIGEDSLYTWLDQIRNGEQEAALRTVRIDLLAENGDPAAVQSWVLKGARITKYTGPTLNGKTATDVAVEEIVLAVERVEMGF
jgi:phage tail-like protein